MLGHEEIKDFVPFSDRKKVPYKDLRETVERSTMNTTTMTTVLISNLLEEYGIEVVG